VEQTGEGTCIYREGTRSRITAERGE